MSEDIAALQAQLAEAAAIIQYYRRNDECRGEGVPEFNGRNFDAVFGPCPDEFCFYCRGTKLLATLHVR